MLLEYSIEMNGLEQAGNLYIANEVQLQFHMMSPYVLRTSTANNNVIILMVYGCGLVGYFHYCYKSTYIFFQTSACSVLYLI